jgi:hypothetical protein
MTLHKKINDIIKDKNPILTNFDIFFTDSDRSLNSKSEYVHFIMFAASFVR